MNLNDILKDMKFDYGSIVRGDSLENPDRLSSGSPALDIALKGGFPCGRQTNIVGDPSFGKTSLCISAAIQSTNQGKEVIWVDTEHKFDRDYAAVQGLDLTKVYIADPSIEEAIDFILTACQASDLGLVVWDSLAQGVSKRALAKDVSDGSFAASESAAYSRHWPRLAQAIKNKNIPLVCTNQWRTKGIGSPTGRTYRDQYGGNTIRYTPSVIIWLEKAKINERAGVPVGQSVEFFIKKSQVSQPYIHGTFEIDFDEEVGWYGVSRSGDLVNMAIDLGLIKKSGSWFSLELGEYAIKSQGKSAFKFDLMATDGAMDSLEREIEILHGITS